MEKLYYRLNIPFSPLVNNFIYPKETVGYTIEDSSILNPLLVNFLKDQGLDISMAVIFCRPAIPPIKKDQTQGVVHSDIGLKNNLWEEIHFGINFELSDSVSRLSWWNVDGERIFPPIPNTQTINDKLRGIHYDKAKNYNLIDFVDIGKQATLVNTNVPHSVNYFGEIKTRWGLSIRFEKNYTWDEAVSFFRPLIES